MKPSTIFLAACCAAAFLSGCTKVRVEGPAVPAPAVKKPLAAAKKNLQNKSRQATEIPPVLGGVVQSDSWVIYKDKQQEEFSGNVSYDNGTYAFKAAYALSQRAKNYFSARGNVWLRQTERDGSFYEAYADDADFNYKTQKGSLSARGKQPVKLVLTDEKKQTVTVYAQKVSFDLNQKIFVLQGNVRVERPAKEGLEIITAKKATYKQLENYILLEGGAKATDSQRTLEADTIIYDGAKNASYAYGARPLVHGKTEQGTFAVIADKVSADNDANRILLDGKVQGWLVSPQLNEADFNSKF